MAPRANRQVAAETPARPNLRTAQKQQTRARILAAALELFSEVGFYGATIDQIAASIGASRATFYLHFPDKEAVLNALVEDYLVRAVEHMSHLPGPLPSRAEIDAWMVELEAFCLRERAYIGLISAVSSVASSPTAFQDTTVSAIITALARNIPAFAAGKRGAAVELERRVSAEGLIAHITWAGQAAVRRTDSAYGKVALKLAGDALHAFVHDPRFAATGS